MLNITYVNVPPSHGDIDIWKQRMVFCLYMLQLKCWWHRWHPYIYLSQIMSLFKKVKPIEEGLSSLFLCISALIIFCLIIAFSYSTKDRKLLPNFRSNHNVLIKERTRQWGILNDLSAQSALLLLDHFSYVFDIDEWEHWIEKSLKTAKQKINRSNPLKIWHG